MSSRLIGMVQTPIPKKKHITSFCPFQSGFLKWTTGQFSRFSSDSLMIEFSLSVSVRHWDFLIHPKVYYPRLQKEEYPIHLRWRAEIPRGGRTLLRGPFSNITPLTLLFGRRARVPNCCSSNEIAFCSLFVKNPLLFNGKRNDTRLLQPKLARDALTNPPHGIGNELKNPRVSSKRWGRP